MKAKARIILSAVILVFGALLAIIPAKTNNPYAPDAREILQEMKTESNMISVDDLSSYLINKDSSVFIVDVRTPKEYAEFTLPGAYNIPVDSVTSETWSGFLNQKIKKVIFFSNGTQKASESWMLCRSIGYKNNYILKGGLNEWFHLIINPTPPKSTQDRTAMAIYRKRLGAKQFFTGAKVEAKTNSAGPVAPINSGKKKTVGGGCG
ncbi:MAG: hypothetical protein A2W91_13205 [Bacteroidetes bacterium GWF2_38_335]|nr:MAG: hypothetical protein A2W91_13205 [Bacteroidetes bacterium GWF2_38_335]OFY77212.1 MAG: hypothetical protein A2281_14870 [Bacteroidetes bacterium RIFOXYA12_FULL_38_20]HBS85786.1 hypothetical protein [Bacteroidales bacterium]